MSDKTHIKCSVCQEKMFISHNYGDKVRLKCTCGHSYVVDYRLVIEIIKV